MTLSLDSLVDNMKMMLNPEAVALRSWEAFFSPQTGLVFALGMVTATYANVLCVVSKQLLDLTF